MNIKRVGIFTLFLVFCQLSAAAPPSAVRETVVASDQIRAKSIVSLKGDIKIEGKVEGSIILIGGKLVLNGVVTQDVICFASKIVVGPNTSVLGDLIALGGTVTEGAKTRVKGDFLYFKFNLKKIENTIIPILSDSKTITFLKTIKIIIWFIIALVVFALVPRKIYDAEKIFKVNLAKSGAVGILSIFLFIISFFIFVIMSFIYIGIPLLLLLLILYFVIYIFGRTVMLFYIGSRISTLLKLKKISTALYLLLGIIFYAFLKFLPIVGPILLIIMNILEIGIGTSYLVRKRLKLAEA
jgi:hypothetical protein